jgi:hypothetical protein
MKYLTFICCSLFLLSCSSNDDSICDCLSAGKNLQSFSSTLLQREATQKDAIQLKKLKKIQSQKCKEFQRMDGAKMLELKEECN